MRKAIVFLLVICMSLSFSSGRLATATNGMYDEDILVFSEEGFNLVVKPGEKTYIRLPVRTKGDIINNPVVTFEAEDSPFTFSRPKLTLENGVPAVTMVESITTNIEFEVTTKETASIKSYPVNLIIKGTSGYTTNDITAVLPFNLRILEEKAPAQLTIGKMGNVSLLPGNKANLSFVVKNEGELVARNAFMSINYGESGIARDYSALDIKIGDLSSGEERQITLPVDVLSTAVAGKKTLIANFTFKTIDGDELKTSYDFSLDILSNDNIPSLDIEEIKSNNVLKPGEEFELIFSLRNYGEILARDLKVTVDTETGSNSFIKNYVTDNIIVNDIKTGASRDVKVPLIVSRNATNGFNAIKLSIEYKDSSGATYTKSKTLYLDVSAEEDKGANIIISNVLQSPKQPVAGGRLEVSFDMENKSAIDLNELKVSLKNLTGNTFIPVESAPYLYLESLKAGTTKRITIPLTVSEDIEEGLNNLLIDYSYTGGGDSINIPILDVQNDLGSASKPRLIISKYEADIDELRAGSVFNFKFEVTNTHTSVAAKNIILTVTGKSSSGQEVFTVTQGSNSFFVSKIGPGETFSEALELKVKSDTATNAYPINVTIEYEYDGIEPNPTTGKVGETEDYELNLQVVENARPVVDYVNVYSWDREVIVNNPASLSFEFYNMGKSTLNNVIATVEGDFMPSGGSMYFMGNVMAGGNAYAEFEVIPNVEGMAYGIVKITYEDSNGEEQVYTKEFEASVMGEQTWDPGIPGDGGVDVFNPTVPEPKKPILATWLFVIIQVIIFILFIPITRKVIINIYKSKLRKKEDEMF